MLFLSCVCVGVWGVVLCRGVYVCGLLIFFKGVGAGGVGGNGGGGRVGVGAAAGGGGDLPIAVH